MKIDNEKNNELLVSASTFVKKLFEKKLPDWALYHSLQHTIDTVEGCLEIGKGSLLEKDDLDVLAIAAWFHDTGFTESIAGHEEKSVEIAVPFLKQNNSNSEFINHVTGCILATKLSIKPQNILEEIICDSDLITLGRQDFFVKNNLLKNEIELRENREITDYDWLQRSFQFLSSHQYYTAYANSTFNIGLIKNRNILERQINRQNDSE